MSFTTFVPQGQTYLIGVSAVNISQGANLVVYRVRCLATAYLTWGTTSGVTAAGAPAGGTPVTNTIGMSTGGIETFTLPPNAWLISTLAASFEVTAGEGI